jgi:polyisoprenyl-teichoic acid--peptidoglycan teichoic acid transferase
VVDALGGVTINNLKPLRIAIDRLGRPGPHPAFELQPGRHRLNGYSALAYSRSRETTSDYDRMQRQRCVIGSLASQADPAQVLAAFPRLVKVLKRSVATDVPASRLPALIEAAGDQQVRVATVGFTPPTYNSGWSSGYPIPDVVKIQSAVRRLTHPSQAGVTATTRSDPDGLGGVTSSTRSQGGGQSSSARRKPTCGTVG